MKGKIFNAQEVQAIIAGTKTMFREVIKPQPNSNINPVKLDYLCWQWATKESRRECPYQVGQKIFVKERFFEEIHPDSLRKNGKIHYDASCDYEVIKVDGDGFQIFYKDGTPASPWKSPVHMEQEHSRLTLEITDVKVERLASISEEDCKKEGIGYTGGWNGEDYDDGEYYFGKLEESKDGMNWENEMFKYPDLAFAELWNATHKKPEEKFEVNPFVWVVNFKINK